MTPAAGKDLLPCFSCRDEKFLLSDPEITRFQPDSWFQGNTTEEKGLKAKMPLKV